MKIAFLISVSCVISTTLALYFFCQTDKLANQIMVLESQLIEVQSVKQLTQTTALANFDSLNCNDKRVDSTTAQATNDGFDSAQGTEVSKFVDSYQFTKDKVLGQLEQTLNQDLTPRQKATYLSTHLTQLNQLGYDLIPSRYISALLSTAEQMPEQLQIKILEFVEENINEQDADLLIPLVLSVRKPVAQTAFFRLQELGLTENTRYVFEQIVFNSVHDDIKKSAQQVLQP